MAVEGYDRLVQRWSRIPQLVQENVRLAMEKLADEIVKEMKAAAPKKKGTLAASIGWTWGDAPAGSMVLGTFNGTAYGAMQLTIYAGGGDAHHARFQEFGTVHMPANPFFYPVWRKKKRGFRRRMANAVKAALEAA